jgi:hypothetical protein
MWKENMGIKERIEMMLIVEARNNLKCCGNCASQLSEFNCPHKDILNKPNGYCSLWSYDNLTQKERVFER